MCYTLYRVFCIYHYVTLQASSWADDAIPSIDEANESERITYTTSHFHLFIQDPFTKHYYMTSIFPGLE